MAVKQHRGCVSVSVHCFTGLCFLVLSLLVQGEVDSLESHVCVFRRSVTRIKDANKGCMPAHENACPDERD